MENINSQKNTDETIEDAVIQIELLRQEVGMMGANDYEISAINTILERLKKGEYNPEKALEEAHKIEARKSDYH